MKSEIIDCNNTVWKEILTEIRHDVYHLPEYVRLEADRNNSIPEAFISIDGDKVFFIPYLVNSCQKIDPSDANLGQIFDIISPYGYPSLLLSEAARLTPEFANAAINNFQKTMQERGVCSAFLRLHPVLSQGFEQIFRSHIFTFNGETVSVNLTLSTEEIWAHTRKGHQSTINKGKRSGFTGNMVPLAGNIDRFMEIYQETMQRVSAKEFYYFDRHYFERLAELGDKIHLCLVEIEGELASTCLFFECDRLVQAHLGGTKDKFLPQSPFNFLLDHVRYWAKERGNKIFHLGGGVGGDRDGVYHFKAGFSRQRHNFLTWRAIVDGEKYKYLVDRRSQILKISKDELERSNFFPAYRAL
jgi:hypothetical protein